MFGVLGQQAKDLTHLAEEKERNTWEREERGNNMLSRKGWSCPHDGPEVGIAVTI